MEHLEKLSLTNMAIHLLQINEDISKRFKHKETNIGNFTLHNFTQIWFNSSGGFEKEINDSYSRQRTYVFIPHIEGEDCIVYFEGKYAYSCPKTKVFIADVFDKKIKGCKNNKEYYKTKI